MAALGAARLIEPGVVLAGTVRRDGTPRISPVEPLILDGDLYLSMLWGSRKARDLTRDPRILVHSVVTGRDGSEGEFKLRGTARAQGDLEVQRRYADSIAEAAGWRPEPGRFHLFTVDLDSVVFIRYDDPTGDQFLTSWPPGREVVRRGTSATSLGPPEPWHELLAAE